VTVTGKFLTAKKVSGHVTVHFASGDGNCNITRAFTAQHG
jgi:hypothetical protein